jgi:uncharacterized protein with PIN domain
MMDDKDNHFVTIDVKTSASNSEKYFCSYCNTRLSPLTQEDMIGAYVCTKCTIQYWPARQQVKKSLASSIYQALQLIRMVM